MPVDFSQNAYRLGSALGQMNKRRRIGNAIAELGPNATWEQKTQKLLEMGFTDDALSMGLLNSRFGEEAPKPMPGYRWSEDRTRQEVIPGSGEDPEVIAKQAQARGGTGGKTLPRILIEDLVSKGESLAESKALLDTYQDGYGGWRNDTLGHAANYAARNFGVGNEEASGWWQRYQNYSNIVRNKLFGSALTVQEKAQWDRANINPGMTDKAIRNNLKTRQEIETRATRKLAKTSAMAGYDKAAIEEAVGLPLDDVAPPAPTNGAPNEDDIRQSLENAKAAIQKNPAIREKVIQRLIEANIDPSGL